MSYEIGKVRFALLTVNSILAGALLGGVVRMWGPQVLGGRFEPLCVGVGFLALFLPLYPVVSTWKQARSGKDLSFGRYLAGALAGAIVAPIIYFVL